MTWMRQVSETIHRSGSSDSVIRSERDAEAPLYRYSPTTRILKLR